jgi:polar amino acid transport system substrate-binding protein
MHRSASVVALIAGLVMAASAASAAELPAIKQKGQLMVGLEAEYVPYESVANGKIVGYDVDVSNAIGKAIGVNVKFVDSDFAGLIPELLTGKIDMIASAVIITKARLQKVSFSMPYEAGTTEALVRANENAINTASDLSGKAVGSQLGSGSASVMQTFDASLPKSGKAPFSQVKLYAHFPEAYIDLANHRTQGVFNSVSSLQVVMKDEPGRFRIVGGVQNVNAYMGIAVRKDSADLLAKIDDTLAKMKADGQLAALQKKWFGQAISTPNAIPAQLP